MTRSIARWLLPLASSLILLIALLVSMRLPARFVTPPGSAELMGAAAAWNDPHALPPTLTSEASAEKGIIGARLAMVPNGRLISVWGDTRSAPVLKHQGEDLAAPHGSPIYAPLDLIIYEKGWNRLGGWTVNGRDSLGRRWYFAHLNEQSSVQVDSTVKAGQIIGYVGNTGDAITTPPHLHYQVSWPNGDWGNPVEVLLNYPETQHVPQP